MGHLGGKGGGGVHFGGGGCSDFRQSSSAFPQLLPVPRSSYHGHPQLVPGEVNLYMYMHPTPCVRETYKYYCRINLKWYHRFRDSHYNSERRYLP